MQRLEVSADVGPDGVELTRGGDLMSGNLEAVRKLAKEVLGSVEASEEWLNTEAMGLEFRKPIELASTNTGAEAVKTLLQRMKFGVYA